MKFGQASVLLAEGATATQQATVTPEGVSVTYSSSNETVATVDAETGEVTAVAAGTAEITATVAADKIHEGSTASYSVTVVAEGDVNKLEGEITWGEIKRSLYGWLTIPYSFKLINYDGAEIAISMQVVDAQGNELPGLTYSQANTPRQAEAAEVTIGLEGEKMVKGTMLAAGTALGTKDNPNSDNLKVRVNATVGGTALQDENTEIESAGNTATGIEDVTVEVEGEAEYFNLQGLRVAQPEAGQLYIKRQGGKAVKVRF
ncbi:MAG: Ig domain-containing protein [Muribaculaceae bacterium]|nr:Ig domain-containing protein [Muribaculaceae bacterium]